LAGRLAVDDSIVKGPARASCGEREAWHAVWTRSHCERNVRDQLEAEGFHTYLPEVAVWVRKDAARRTTHLPLFPGYLFLRHRMDKSSYIAAIKVRGIVGILGQSWDRLETIPEGEIETIRTVLEARVRPQPFPYVREGERVTIRRGPLAGVEGILKRIDAERGLLVISVHLFQRSLSVEVDCTLLSPIGWREPRV
jgi:transcription antitermination factor NusG